MYSQSEGSSDQVNYEETDRHGYGHKIDAIWENIEKTKKMEQSDDETYEMYREKRKASVEYSGDGQYDVDKQMHKRVLSNMRAKMSKQGSQPYHSEAKRKTSYQKNLIPTSSNPKKPSQSIKQSLKASNNNLQHKLQKSKQNTNILMKKLIEAQEQIEYLEYELEKQIKQKQQLLIELNRKNTIQTVQKENKAYNINGRIAGQKDRQVEMRLMKDKYELRIRSAQNQLHEKNLLISHLHQQITNLKSEITFNRPFPQQKQQLSTANNFKGAELLQLSSAQKSIQRLFQLLKSTQEYRVLGNFAQQVKQIYFLANIPKNISNTLSGIKISSRKKQSSCPHCNQVKINERLLWTPELCYKKMLQMKIKYDTLNEDCIEEVLFQINKLYLSKQQTRVNKLKSYYEAEIQKLKKKTQLTYDELLAKKQIERLKRQINSKPNSTNKTSTKQKKPKMQSLKVIGQYEDQLKLKQKQIKLLTERIKLLQTQNTGYDKSLYMQGVLWIIDKVLQELDANSQHVREFETRFRNKINTVQSPDDWIRLFKDFFENIEEINHTLIQKVLGIKQNTIQKITAIK